jgi:hypothetical protein
MKCEAKVCERRWPVADQSRRWKLPARAGNEYSNFEVGTQPMFNIRKLPWVWIALNTFSFLINAILTTIQTQAKAW